MNGPVEPSGDMRQLATFHFEMYAAYVQAGFEPLQALNLVGAWIRSASNKDES